jgi:hypothetical protein
MSFEEVTQSVERMEMLEERLGIRLQGIMATVRYPTAFAGKHELTVAGEIYSPSGSSLEADVSIVVVAQNEKGQVVGTTSQTIRRDKFIGYEVLNMMVYCNGHPSRVKIVPKRP